MTKIFEYLLTFASGGGLFYLLTLRSRIKSESAAHAGSRMKSVTDMVDEFTKQLAEMSTAISTLTNEKRVLEQRFAEIEKKLSETVSAHNAAEKQRQQLMLDLNEALKTIEKLKSQLQSN